MEQLRPTNRQPVLLLSGGAGGIGFAVAERLGAEGAHIALTDCDAELLRFKEEVLHQKGCSVRSWALDVTKLSDCQAVVSEVVQHFGGLDIVVHCAGLTHVSPFLKTQPDVYRRVMEVNFFGAVALTQASIDALLAARGQIIVLSSIAGFAPLLGRTGYCASKYALHGFFETLRCELKNRGVSVTLVCPSFVNTDFATKGLNAEGAKIDFDRTTTGRPVQPEEVANAIHRAIRRRSRMLVLSRTGKLAYWVSRLAPGFYEASMLRRFKKELERDNR